MESPFLRARLRTQERTEHERLHEAEAEGGLLIHHQSGIIFKVTGRCPYLWIRASTVRALKWDSKSHKLYFVDDLLHVDSEDGLFIYKQKEVCDECGAIKFVWVD
jgi:hypothetical protein